MDTAFDNQFFVRIQFPVSEFFCDDLKTSALDISRFYIFQFYLHIYTPSSRISYIFFISRCSRSAAAKISYCVSLNVWWGEGEVKFYIDGDEEYPTICGTGTEDYFGGSWSFAKQVDGKTVEQNYCTPYLGYPYYSSHDELIHNFYHNDDVMPMRGFYRWHIQDPICFDEDLKVTIQQIGVGYRGLFERQDDVASVAYWYQAEPHNSFPELPGKEDRWPR